MEKGSGGSALFSCPDFKVAFSSCKSCTQRTGQARRERMGRESALPKSCIGHPLAAASTQCAREVRRSTRSNCPSMIQARWPPRALRFDGFCTGTVSTFVLCQLSIFLQELVCMHYLSRQPTEWTIQVSEQYRELHLTRVIGEEETRSRWVIDLTKDVRTEFLLP
jgi:hypothetical protein